MLQKNDFDALGKSKKHFDFWEKHPWLPFSAYFREKAKTNWELVLIIIWLKQPGYNECPFVLQNCHEESKSTVFNYLVDKLDTFEKFNWIWAYHQDLFDEQQKKILQEKLESISETYLTTLKNSGRYPEFLKENFEHFPDNKKRYALGALKSLITRAKIPEKKIILSKIGSTLAQKVGMEYWEELPRTIESRTEASKIIGELFGSSCLHILESGQKLYGWSFFTFISNLEYFQKEKIEKEFELSQKIKMIGECLPNFIKRNPGVFELLIKKHTSANDIEIIFDLTPSWFGKNSEEFTKIMSLFIISLEIRRFDREREKHYWEKYNQHLKIMDAVYIGT